jgi:hypothetical protein
MTMLFRMTNYALTMLVIFYLQQLEAPLLHPLHTLIHHFQVPGTHTLILHFQVFIRPHTSLPSLYTYSSSRSSYTHTLIPILHFQVFIRSHRSLPVFIHAPYITSKSSHIYTPHPGLHNSILHL